MTQDAAPTRQSLDSARFPRLPRAPLRGRRLDQGPHPTEEGFEDVGLNDESKTAQQQQQQPSKRRGFFKFGSEHTEPPPQQPPNAAAGAAPQSSVSRFLISGRKRGQSGQGAELGAMERPKTAGSAVDAPQEVQVGAGQ